MKEFKNFFEFQEAPNKLQVLMFCMRQDQGLSDKIMKNIGLSNKNKKKASLGWPILYLTKMQGRWRLCLCLSEAIVEHFLIRAFFFRTLFMAPIHVCAVEILRANMAEH